MKLKSAKRGVAGDVLRAAFAREDNNLAVSMRKSCRDIFVTAPRNKLRGAVTVKEVVRYYAGDARNISSGCRTLAGYVGDWRPIDELAQICLNWFKRVNHNGLARAAKPYGMELRG